MTILIFVVVGMCIFIIGYAFGYALYSLIARIDK